MSEDSEESMIQRNISSKELEESFKRGAEKMYEFNREIDRLEDGSVIVHDPDCTCIHCTIVQ